jgi:hypothetical protein
VGRMIVANTKEADEMVQKWLITTT